MDNKYFFQDVFLPFSFSSDPDVFSVELDKALQKTKPVATELKILISLVQFSPILTFLLDKDKKIIYMNDKAKNQLNDANQYLGQKITDLSVANLHKSDVKNIWQHTTTDGHWAGTIDYLDYHEKKRKQWIKLIQLKTNTEPLYALYFLLYL